MTDERTYDASNERRTADRRQAGGSTMTSDTTDTDTNRNMYDERGRPATATEPVESQRTSRGGDMWPEMSDYRMRFDQIQSRFIEDPRGAVRDAEKLVEEAIEKMSSSMRDRVHSMKGDADSGDTEKLRVEMKNLRDMVESMGGRRTTV